MALQHLLQLDRQGNLPLYQQIAEQIRIQISDGRLPVGTRLPTVRHLANTLGVTRLTVHSAYSELQSGGWVEATVGRGTFVAASTQPLNLVTAAEAKITADGVLDDMRRISEMAGLRSLGYADPDPALYPTREFWESLISLRSDASVFQYGSPQGDPLLRVELAALANEQGIGAMPDELVVTGGVSQGLALVTEALTSPGDKVVVEQPTYLGLLHILKMRGLQPVGIPLDDEGPCLDVLERVIVQQQPKFFYTIPRFHNPTGICMSPARQRDLLALAERHDLIIVEDDIYGRLYYDNPPPPPLKTLDRHERVIYVDSVSKVMQPGLRIGYMIAPPSLHKKLLSLRRASDLCGPPLLQRALADFLHRGRLKVHIRRMLPIYRERRDTLLRALQYWMPESAGWTRPTGGFCCWVTLPGSESLRDLYQAALSHGLVFTPGEVFLAEPDGCVHLRLCFGSQTTGMIREGVALLGDLVRERIGRRARRNDSVPDWGPLV